MTNGAGTRTAMPHDLVKYVLLVGAQGPARGVLLLDFCAREYIVIGVFKIHLFLGGFMK